MASFAKLLAASSMVALAQGHGILFEAKGIRGSPFSAAFGINPRIPRDCTSIQPCQQDTTIIRDAEISQNIVNKCGRTQLTGNIDIGENTENYLAAGNKITAVRPGTEVSILIHQINADGAGPYSCDIDQTSNGGTFTNLVVTKNVPGSNGLSTNKVKNFTMIVNMPRNLRCSGGSSGNVCTVRCRNAAVAGPFGGCFPVQQLGVGKFVNNPKTIPTANTKKEIDTVQKSGQRNLQPATDANNQANTKDTSKQSVAILNKLLQDPLNGGAPQVSTGNTQLGGIAQVAAANAQVSTGNVQTGGIAPAGTNNAQAGRTGTQRPGVAAPQNRNNGQRVGSAGGNMVANGQNMAKAQN